MKLAEFRSAIVAAFAKKLTCANVASLGGRLDENELKRIAMRSPAVRVAILGVDGLDNRGAPEAIFSLAAFVVCGTGRKGEAAEEGALALVGAVLEILEGNRFGCDASHPSSVRAENLYSGELDAGHAALWAITWKQGLDIKNNIKSPELDDFLRCFVREKEDGPLSNEIHLPGEKEQAQC